jgi:DNA-binding transcriptional MerR regulator
MLISTKKAAAFLDVSEGTLRYWRHLGIGPAFTRINRNSVRYDECDIQKYVADRRVEPSVRALVETTYANLH